MTQEALAQLLPFVVLIAAFYLLAIRPQQKRNKAHQELVASLVEGDRVITIGGMHGTVRTLEDDRVGLEVATGTIVEFARSAVAQKIEG
jgi:preprotein translocase subunit YajC